MAENETTDFSIVLDTFPYEAVWNNFGRKMIRKALDELPDVGPPLGAENWREFMEAAIKDELTEDDGSRRNVVDLVDGGDVSVRTQAFIAYEATRLFILKNVMQGAA